VNIELLPLISFVIVTTFTPGPNNISSASMGMIYGYRKTVSYLVGIASGFFFVMIACAYLSSTLLTFAPAVEGYLRWIGAGYIVWLAIDTLRISYSFSESNGAPRAFTKGCYPPVAQSKGGDIRADAVHSLSGPDLEPSRLPFSIGGYICLYGICRHIDVGPVWRRYQKLSQEFVLQKDGEPVPVTIAGVYGSRALRDLAMVWK